MSFTVVEAMDEARKAGRGAVALDGRFIDIGSIKQAGMLLEKAARIAEKGGSCSS